MEYRTITCPHCGKEMPVPQDLISFPCMYCSSQISLSAPEDPEATLLDCFFDAESYISRMNYKEYRDAFAEYYKKCKSKFDSIDAMITQDPTNAATQADMLVSHILENRAAEIQGKSVYERNSIEARDQMFLALYMIPAILAAKGINANKTTEAIRDTWNKRVPKAHLSIGTYDKIAAGFHRKFLGLCFITTAVCEFYNKPDDCEELTTLRNFRDTYMASTEHGRALIREYYECAPQIVVLIDLCCDRAQVYTDLYNRYILPCIKLIHENKNQECLELYCTMVNELKFRFAIAA